MKVRQHWSRAADQREGRGRRNEEDRERNAGTEFPAAILCVNGGVLASVWICVINAHERRACCG